MAGDISVSGANQLAAVTKRLKQAGANEVRKDMLRGLRVGAKPLVAVARQSAVENLPRAGGLDQVVAASKFAVRTRTSGRNPGVRVVALSGHNIAAMDRGRLRHPTYGHRDRWVTQKIKPGWWTDALTARAPEVRTALVAVLAETARRIEHG